MKSIVSDNCWWFPGASHSKRLSHILTGFCTLSSLNPPQDAAALWGPVPRTLITQVSRSSTGLV